MMSLSERRCTKGTIVAPYVLCANWKMHWNVNSNRRLPGVFLNVLLVEKPNCLYEAADYGGFKDVSCQQATGKSCYINETDRTLFVGHVSRSSAYGATQMWISTVAAHQLNRCRQLLMQHASESTILFIIYAFSEFVFISVLFVFTALFRSRSVYVRYA